MIQKHHYQMPHHNYQSLIKTSLLFLQQNKIQSYQQALKAVDTIKIARLDK
jgi:hypothetical protein